MAGNFLKYELLKLTRHSWQILSFGLIFFICVLAIGYGNREVKEQHTVLSKIQENQQNNINELKSGFNADTTQEAGNTAYHKSSNPAMVNWYLQRYAINKPQPYAHLSLGVRDLFPFYIKLKPHSLFMQLFQNEIGNPLKLFVGHFDLSFVIIYLFPILIIAIGYNLLSEEKEQGTLPLWIINGVPVKQMLRWKLLFYFVALALIAFLVILIGFTLVLKRLIADG